MLSFAIYPKTDDKDLITAIDWHLRALTTHNIPYQLNTTPESKSDIVLCTDTSAKPLRKAHNIDPLMATDPAGALNRMVLEYLPHTALAKIHADRFKTWVGAQTTHTKTRIYSTGPSGDFRTDPSALNLITASPTISRALEDKFPVSAILISDCLALTGNTPHAIELRTRIQTLQARDNCPLITTLANAVVIEPYWPKSQRGLLIGIPESHSVSTAPLLSNTFACFPTGNVLTALILPVATALKAPIELYGFDGVLGVNLEIGLAHRNTPTQSRNKHALLRTAFGSGYLFPQDYLTNVTMDVAQTLAAYTRHGHKFSAPDWELSTQPPTHQPSKFKAKLRVNLYTFTELLDAHPFSSACLFAIFITSVFMFGTQFMPLQTLFIIAVFLILTLFCLGFLHLRTRAKRLADLAERRASEKSHRAFETMSARMDEIETKLER